MSTKVRCGIVGLGKMGRIRAETIIENPDAELVSGTDPPTTATWTTTPPRPGDLFAFPFGQDHQLSEENRSLIRDLGFRCAPSCHGGKVSPGDDPYWLRRQPISPWYADPGQFAYEIVRD